MGVCNCTMFCCTLLYVHSSIAIILMGKRELVALLNLSFWCVMVEWLFLAVPWGCMRFVIVVFPDHTHLLFLNKLEIRELKKNVRINTETFRWYNIPLHIIIPLYGMRQHMCSLLAMTTLNHQLSRRITFSATIVFQRGDSLS